MGDAERRRLLDVRWSAALSALVVGLNLAVMNVAFAAGSMLAGSAPWLWLLIAARGVQGVGAACITPSSMALLLDATPVGERAAATGFLRRCSSATGSPPRSR
jgi:MFS family permease